MFDPPPTGARRRRAAAARSHAIAGDRRRAARPPHRGRLSRTPDRARQAPRVQADRHFKRRAGRRQPAGPTARPRPAQPSVTVRGALTDARGPGLRMLEWSVPEAVELTPRNVKRANPASWIRVADLAAQQDAVPDLRVPAVPCRPVDRARGHWLPPGAWQACIGEPELADGERIWRRRRRRRWRPGRRHRRGLGQRAACTSAAPCSRARPASWRPGTRSKSWPSATAIVEVAFDPWRASQIAQELQQRGVRVSAFATDRQRG